MFVGVGIGTGAEFGCALTSDGEHPCWGDRFFPQLPDGLLVQISVRRYTVCGVSPAGSVECWCDPELFTEMCRKPAPTETFTRVVYGGGNEACAQRPNGTLRCWDGYHGGAGSLDATPIEPVLDFDVGAGFACAVLLDGTLTCWGDTWRFSPKEEYDETGEFGLGEVPPLDLAYVDVSVGGFHGCALDRVGDPHCWGVDGYDSPYPDSPAHGPFEAIDTESVDTCGLHPNGLVECWGPPEPPVPMYEEWSSLESPDLHFAAFDVGADAGCGIRHGGKHVACWGEQLDAGVEYPSLD